MNIEMACVDSVLVYFGDAISKAVSLKVKSAYRCLKQLNHQGLVELIPSYTSLYISYDIFEFDFISIKSFLHKHLKNLTPYEHNNANKINIDVYYGIEVGFDLQRIASLVNMGIQEVIQLHSSPIYDVYAIGFLPGFAYLGRVNKQISVSRLSTPRKHVPKGSVAMADYQTAVYPTDSPGGWNIIGKTTFEFFNKSLEELSPLCIDTRIKFNPISKEQFISQGGEI